MATRVNLEDYTGNVRRAKVNETVPVERLIPALVTSLKLPSKDAEGQPITYGLHSKGQMLAAKQTLQSQNIRQNDTVSIIPIMPAPGTIPLPDQIEQNSSTGKGVTTPR